MDKILKRMEKSEKLHDSDENFTSESSEISEYIERKIDDKKKLTDQSKFAPSVMKHKPKVKFTILILASMITFGNFYSLDVIALVKSYIEHEIKSAGVHYTNQDFGSQYAFIFFPNIFMPVITGLIIDKYGLRIALITLGLFALTGSMISGFGGSIHIKDDRTFKESAAFIGSGRLVTGFNLISLLLCQTYFVADWFSGAGSLNLAFAMTSTLPYLAPLLSSFLTPRILLSSHDDLVYWAAFMFQVMSFIFICVVVAIDRYAEKDLERIQKSWLRISSKTNATETTTFVKPSFRFRDIKDFGTAYWINVLACVCMRITTWGFIFWVPHLYNLRFGYSESEAALKISIPYSVCMFSALPIGWFCDKYGKQMYVMILANLLVFSAYVMENYIKGYDRNQYPNGPPADICDKCSISNIPLFFIGFSIAVQNVLNNGSINQLLIKEQALGSALGFSYAIQYLFMTPTPLIIGYWVDSDGDNGVGFGKVGYMMFGLSLLSLACNIALAVYNRLYLKNRLNTASKEITNQDKLRKALLTESFRMENPDSSVIEIDPYKK